MSDGKVAVRQNGHEHAVDAPRLNDQLQVDLDHVEVPRVKLPSEVVVEYQDGDDVQEETLQTDGGETVDRTHVEMGGSQTISDDLAMWAIIATGGLLMSAGYLFGIEASGSGLIAMVAGGLLGYIAIPSFWSEQP
ncbi:MULTISPECIES: hypothetical protein [Halorubrum]|uniref:Uncharacterized protein n=1 Tax=Halorubrum hochstenium ATCC 700873 TaxID=1227481 RepID=M0F9Q7_9EURY|nr:MULTISPECIES: hypothetical protein [Halorubrum]ELZ56771.1 hypothetical protein C467_07857 [Halorubrum hochstenium ATCC 700873]